MTNKKIAHGNFDKLAQDYAKYRPGYSETVLKALLSLVEKNDIDFADVGAGTGIWTRIVSKNPRIKSAIAIEPSDQMREQGLLGNGNLNIEWKKGNGENTGLAPDSKDLLSMASSFHWVDFEKGMKEFARVLRSGGRFVALWNPRFLKDNPVLVEIEEQISKLCPDIKRVSSGSSDFVNKLTDRLSSCQDFEDLVYIEAKHSINLTKEQYIGVWRSVNDLQFQMGDKFPEFMQFIEDKISDLPYIKSTYLTRAWSVKRK
jgi:ubiquinone/menaquinone biosynthesis C-methylase UbiE